MFTPTNGGKRAVGENAGKYKFAIIVSDFNKKITDALLDGAMECLTANGAREKNIDIVRVPGAFEIPLTAQSLAMTKKYAAIVCLGAIIRGETTHYELVASECARGILDAGMKTNVPILFGVLAVNTRRQAIARAQKNETNKGWETALAAIQMASLFASKIIH